MLFRSIVAILILCSPAKAAEPTFRTIQDLLGDCKSDDVARKIGCIAYVSGVGDMMGVVKIARQAVPDEEQVSWNFVAVCSTESITAGQMMQAFINWAEKNPKEWQKPIIVGAWNALRETWPCK